MKSEWFASSLLVHKFELILGRCSLTLVLLLLLLALGLGELPFFLCVPSLGTRSSAFSLLDRGSSHGNLYPLCFPNGILSGLEACWKKLLVSGDE